MCAVTPAGEIMKRLLSPSPILAKREFKYQYDDTP